MKAVLFMLAGVSLIFAACSSWHGPAEVQLKDGTVLQCAKGLAFVKKGVICERSDGGIEIPWNQVAGYRTK